MNLKVLKVVTGILTCVLLISNFSANAKSVCLNPHRWNEDPVYLMHGYCDRGYYIFGYITNSTAQLQAPAHSIGSVVWFNPNKMEETAAINGTNLTGYLDGIALMSCSDVGKEVYLQREGYDKEGPFIVASCAWQAHMFGSICYIGEVAEVGFKTAERWGMVSLVNNEKIVNRYREDNVQVFVNGGVTSSETPVDYRSWWLDQVEFTSGLKFKDMGVSCKP